MHGHAPHEVYTFAEAGVNIHPEDEITFVQETAERTWAAVERAHAEVSG